MYVMFIIHVLDLNIWDLICGKRNIVGNLTMRLFELDVAGGLGAPSPYQTAGADVTGSSSLRMHVVKNLRTHSVIYPLQREGLKLSNATQ